MSSLGMFLGFSVDEHFQKALVKANPYLVSLLIGKKEYLHEISYDGKRFLGKNIEGYPTLDQLTDIEIHLISLLKRLSPQYPFKSNPPQLLILHARS